MKLHASGEDYLETILVLKKKLGMVRSVDVARHMEVSKPSVCHAVASLRDGGFLMIACASSTTPFILPSTKTVSTPVSGQPRALSSRSRMSSRSSSRMRRSPSRICVRRSPLPLLFILTEAPMKPRPISTIRTWQYSPRICFSDVDWAELRLSPRPSTLQPWK